MRNFKPVNPVSRDPNGKMGIDIASISDMANSVKYSQLEAQESITEVTTTAIGKVTAITGDKTFNFYHISIDNSNIVYTRPHETQEAITLNKLPDADDYVQLLLVRCQNGAFKWIYINANVNVTYLEEQLAQCCGCSRSGVQEHAQKGCVIEDEVNSEYLDPGQPDADWETLRDSIIAGANNTGAAQNEPVGQLGRYMRRDMTEVDIDTLNIVGRLECNDKCQFHHDTTLDPSANIISAVLIADVHKISTGLVFEDFFEKFTFSLRYSDGTAVRTGMSSDTPDFGSTNTPYDGRFKFTLDPTKINTTGDTTFYWQFESEWDAPCNLTIVYPDDDAQYWNGWMWEPVTTLYLLTDIPCS
jgi:hypothetical protein